MTTDKIRVYIASPYTIGDPAANVRRQMEAANLLIGSGFAPFIPLLYHFQHITFPRPYEDWMALDLTWITVCNCLLRLEGESAGADREVEHAQKNNIPVFYSIDKLFKAHRLKQMVELINKGIELPKPSQYGPPGNRTPEYYRERTRLLCGVDEPTVELPIRHVEVFEMGLEYANTYLANMKEPDPRNREAIAFEVGFNRGLRARNKATE